jgi:uncharacterized protein DUF1996
LTIKLRLLSASGVFLLALFCAALFAGAADAEPRIKVNCKINATNRVDAIAYSQHLHHQFANTSTTNSSTGDSLFGSRSTSCDMNWFTSAGWFPAEQNEPVRAVNVYYRAPGDQKQVKAIPKGLQLLATREQYNCGADGTFQNTPPYGCRGNWTTRIIFPDCWNQKSSEETSMVYGSNNGVCPSTHPYRIPKISYLVMHKYDDGRVQKPLLVSGGVDVWEPWSFMHGDYFAANQSVFNDRLIDLCLRNAPDSVTVAHPECGQKP